MLHDILELIDQYFVDYVEEHKSNGKKPSLDYHSLTREIKQRSSYFFLTVNTGPESDFDLNQFIKNYIDFYLVLIGDIVFNANDLCCCFDNIVTNVNRTNLRLEYCDMAFLTEQTRENFNKGYLF